MTTPNFSSDAPPAAAPQPQVLLPLPADLKLAIGLPSYDGRRHNALPLMQLCRNLPRFAPVGAQGSLLAYVFNMILCRALELRDQGEATHFLMLHDDIIPTDPMWFQQLMSEYLRTEAEMMCVISPIKNQDGLTSIAIEGPTKWNPRRITMAECMMQEKTFSHPHLLLNSGMLLFDLRQKWLDTEKVFFNIDDRIITGPDGKRVATVASEDWEFTRRARANGCTRIFATRAVRILHMGGQAFPNDQVWGTQTDGDPVLNVPEVKS